MTATPHAGSPLPEAAWSGDARVFGAFLADEGQDYLLVDQPDDQRARVRFLGPFQGRLVVWDCEFLTLAADPGRPLRNFIEVGQPTPRGQPLRVGLSLPRIDRSAIRKMVIMIRNYKRLAPGRHEYGEPRRNVSRAP